MVVWWESNLNSGSLFSVSKDSKSSYLTGLLEAKLS